MGTTKLLKLPKSLGACADLYYNTREQRLALQRQVDELQVQETAIKDHIIATMPKSDGGAVGKLVRVTVTVKPKPIVEDWDKFYAFVAKNRAKGGFALLNRAVNAKSVGEYWDANKEVPGVGKMNIVGLSVNKL